MNASDSIFLPKGYKFSAIAAGIKASGKPDLAAILCGAETRGTALFTQNCVVAAPVEVGRAALASTRGRVRAVLVNSGNANCATGKAGIRDCKSVCAQAARLLKVRASEVFPSSTGIIGVPLPTGKIRSSLQPLLANAGDSVGHLRCFADAILTTDTRPKIASVPLRSGSGAITGIAKGSGMIHPQVATMLVYLLTDVTATAAELDSALRLACAESFNTISVDGDTSTNDTVVLLANGCSGVRPDPNEFAGFAEGVAVVMETLARQIARDGEGAKKLITIDVTGAANDDTAAALARAIANSPLVKTAIAGSDPNWGRILSAAGNAGVAFDPAKVDIDMQEVLVCRGGLAARFSEDDLKQKLDQPDCAIHFQIRGKGKGRARFWTCDFTEGYIRINASYRT
jgi:glutamate N-acetyltransferase/amino-acid N-acetyltransferase